MKKIYQLIILLSNMRLTPFLNKKSDYKDSKLELEVSKQCQAAEREVLSIAANLNSEKITEDQRNALSDYITALYAKIKGFVDHHINGRLHQIEVTHSQQHTDQLMNHNTIDAESKDRRIRQINLQLDTALKLDFNPRIVAWVWMFVIILGLGDIVVFMHTYSKFSKDSNWQTIILSLSLGLGLALGAHKLPAIIRRQPPQKQKRYIFGMVVFMILFFWVAAVLRTVENNTYQWFSLPILAFTLINLFLFFVTVLVSRALPSKEQQIQYEMWRKLNNEKNNLIQDIATLDLQQKHLNLSHSSLELESYRKRAYQQSLNDRIDKECESAIHKFAIHSQLFKK